MWGNVTLLNNG